MQSDDDYSSCTIEEKYSSNNEDNELDEVPIIDLTLDAEGFVYDDFEVIITQKV